MTTTAARKLEVLRKVDAGRTTILDVSIRDAGRRDIYRVVASTEMPSHTWTHCSNPKRSYRVVVGGGVPLGCSCPAGRAAVGCQHFAASKVLIEQGSVVV